MDSTPSAHAWSADGPVAASAADAPWCLSPAWRLEILNGMLLVSAGADAVYVVDEAPPEARDQVLALCRSGVARSWQHDPVMGAAIRQLRRLGALVPAQALAASDRPSLYLHWVGQPLPALADAFQDHGWSCQAAAGLGSALTLLVRTTSTMAELLAAYQAAPPLDTHVLLDLAYQHTLGIGPMVVPGQTACLACMGQRVMQRWGDLPPPAAPALLRRAAGIAALLADAAVLGPSLVERACTLDLQNLRLQSSPVFPEPDCPVCAVLRVQDERRDIPLPLPWLP